LHFLRSDTNPAGRKRLPRIAGAGPVQVLNLNPTVEFRPDRTVRHAWGTPGQYGSQAIGRPDDFSRI
jgi:hypothetical protein